MTIKITSDSTCDLSKELLERYDISLAPLYIIKNGKVYKDGVDITPGEIFDYVGKTGDFCTTSAVSTFDYIQFFERHAPKYDAVIHITIGSGFSLCNSNANAAAKIFENVHVVDSKNLSAGQGHVVVEAARLAAEGAAPEAILRELERIVDRVETSFLLDQLDYIYKGGRCSLAAALGANILHLRTCVEVSGGMMQVTKKYRGAFENAIYSYVHDKLQGRGDIDPRRIFVTHTAVSRKAVETAIAAIGRAADFKEVIETQAGCTVSCHCGPGTLGVLFLRK